MRFPVNRAAVVQPSLEGDVGALDCLHDFMSGCLLLLQNIESRLKVLLPDDVGAALMDGVVLCHLANHISPRSVASIHVPSPAVVRQTRAPFKMK